MKYIETRINWTKKLGAAAALGTFAVAPFIGAPQSVQADPKDEAPAHGYRRKQNSNVGDRNQTQRYTLNGIVTNATSGNTFTVRTDSGRTVRVQANNTPRNLSTGDRVTVSGYASNGVFIGENVRVVRDDRNDDRNDRDTWFGRDRDRDRDDDDYGDDWSRTNRSTDTTVYGVVTRDLGGNTFEVRTDDGRLVTVRARNGEPNRLTRGDRVVAQGRFNPERNVFVAETVRITRNDDAGRVNFPGTVTSIGTRNRLSVRGDNGRTYIVNTRHAVSTDLRKGDRVRVVGDARNGVVTAAQVQEISRNTNDRNGRDNDRRIEFTGTVVVAGWMGQQLTIRRDDGKQFSITAPRDSGSFRNGDRVRVVGWKLDGGRVQATSITRL